MNLLLIAWKSIRQRALASSLTCLSISLGVMLMVIVLVGSTIVEKNFNQNSINYDLIVGPKGSRLELVLNTVFRIGNPIGNVPYRFYQQLKDDRRFEEVVPLAMGDVTEEGGFKIVGTISRYFELDYAPGRPFKMTNDSKRFGTDFDAIIGSQVARDNEWGLGKKLKLVHGGSEGHVHDEEFTVVGILAPTGTANDKTVFVNLEGFYAISGHDKPVREAVEQMRQFDPDFSMPEEEIARIEQQQFEEEQAHKEAGGGHAHHHSHETPDILKDLTAIFVQTKSPMTAVMLEGASKRGYGAQFVNPIGPINDLMTDVVGNVRILMFWMTVLIIIVSGVGIFVSIYNSMSDRRKEIAIMRALGARRQTVFSIILAESVLLCVAGGILGTLLGHSLVYFGASRIEYETGILVERLTFNIWELVLFPVMLILATLIGFLPGMTAYRTDVADALYA